MADTKEPVKGNGNGNGNGGRDTVNITTRWGGLSLGGKNAIDILLFIALLGLAGLSVWESLEHSKEHTSLNCMIKLALYMQGQPRDGPVDWRNMPVDTFPCVPRFIYERNSNR